jgi:hypothetical protein
MDNSVKMLNSISERITCFTSHLTSIVGRKVLILPLAWFLKSTFSKNLPGDKGVPESHIHGGWAPRPGRDEVGHVTMLDLTKTSYGVGSEIIFGGPNWLNDGVTRLK